MQLWTLVQCIAQTRVDCDHVVLVPKYLLNEIGAAMFRDDIRRTERRYPNLMYALH